MTNPQNPYNPEESQARQGNGNLPSYGSYNAAQQSSGGEVPPYGGNQYDNAQAGAPQYPTYDSQFAVEDNRKNGAALWALIFAILGLLMLISLALSIFAFIPGILGLILSLVALSKAKKITGSGRRKAMAVAALVISILVTLSSVVIVGFMVVLGTEVVQACDGLNEAQFSECVNDYVTQRFNV